MSRVIFPAQFTFPAPDIDLTDNAFADHLRKTVRTFDDPDKFMPDRPFKPGVSAYDLQVCIAYPAPCDPYQGLIGCSWNPYLGEAQFSALNSKCFHILKLALQ